MDFVGGLWRFMGVPSDLISIKLGSLRASWEILMAQFSLGGDFNEVLGSIEIEGEVLTKRQNSTEFREVMEEFYLWDLGYCGEWFTWERGKLPGKRIREPLGRVLASTG